MQYTSDAGTVIPCALQGARACAIVASLFMHCVTIRSMLPDLITDCLHQHQYMPGCSMASCYPLPTLPLLTLPMQALLQTQTPKGKLLELVRRFAVHQSFQTTVPVQTTYGIAYRSTCIINVVKGACSTAPVLPCADGRPCQPHSTMLANTLSAIELHNAN